MSKWDEYLDAAVTEKSEQPVDTIVDAHTHIGHVRFDSLPVTPERLVEYMDDHGIDRSIVFPLESPGGSAHYVETKDVLEAAAAYPDRIVPFGSVDPGMQLHHGEERWRAIMERHVDRGIRGFGELKANYPIDHERMRMIYRFCDDYDLPVLIHIDGEFCMDEKELPGLERMLREFPDVDFILHAPGWWIHISADVSEDGMTSYPDRSVEPGGRCDELLGEYDNCYADFSMGSGFNALTRDEEYGQTFLERHHEKLIFGSDYLFPGQTVPQFGFFEKFDLTDDQWANIWHRNVERLLR